MPMNETLLLRRLQRRIGSKLYNCVDEQFFMDVLNEETLETFSSYYPKLVRGIRITAADAIPTYDPQTGVTEYHRYVIPKLNPDSDEYIGIEQFLFPGQGFEQTMTGFNQPLVDAAFAKIRSLEPIPPIRYTCTFEEPNFCLISPYRRNHVDFTLVMQRKIKLSEIPNGLEEYFLRLFTFDCKLALYNEFPAARESGVINGIEVNTTLSDFSNAAADREALLDIFEEDYYKNPDRFGAFFDQGV